MSGEYSAKFTYDFKGDRELWDPYLLANASQLKLNLTFNEGEKITAYLPLTIKPVVGTLKTTVGNWYFAYDADPWAFWASNNASTNAKKFASVGDPLGILARLPGTLVVNAAGNVAGAKANIYAADLGDRTMTFSFPVWKYDENNDPVLKDGLHVIETVKVDVKNVDNGNAFAGRATYGLPLGFDLGIVGAYTDGLWTAALTAIGDPVASSHSTAPDTRKAYEPVQVPEATAADPAAVPHDLTFGADVSGKVPGMGDATLTLAGAGYWTKNPHEGFKFEGATDNAAYMAKLSALEIGPVTANASYTAVGGNFVSRYASTKATALLNKYKGSAAAELDATVELPIGMPATLTLTDTLWMGYPANPLWNETTGSVEVTPMENLVATVEGGYKAHLDKDDATKANEGYYGHADVKYTTFGMEIKPYADYLAKSYADDTNHGTVAAPKVVDTIVGVKVSGNPLTGLELNAEASYQIEEPTTYAKTWGVYTTELNPGFVKSAKSQLAGVAELNKEGKANATTEFYGYAGSEMDVTDKLSAKVGVLTKDSEEKIAAHAGLTYKASDSITAGLVYTYRQLGVTHAAGSWVPFDDKGVNYVKASVTGTVGKSTITLAYGVDGLADPDDPPTFHAGKAWAWLRNHPGAPMDWQLLSVSVKVPF